MITEFLVQVFANSVAWLFNLFPDYEMPAFLSGTSSLLAQVTGMFYGLGVWVNWAFLGVAVSAVLVAYGVGLTIKAMRLGL